ncbi:MAG: type II toxin-antitoxin system HicB family antitoxin [Candidatus Hydrogenedentes bacterium]|nr:type II toxin-antitoxin system HicB family antitoxin [Candidatus Hydrogenedentota bacterium]
MNVNFITHLAEEGGFWAEVPAMPRCATQEDTFEDLLENVAETIQGCLLVRGASAPTDGIEVDS